jgi:NitT/TauT family transport system substrate-binding protein
MQSPDLRLDRRGVLRAALAGAAAFAAPSIVRAAAPRAIKLGTGFGVGFLPLLVAQELKLVEKHAASAGQPLDVTYERFSGSAAMQDAVLSGAIAAGAYGVPAMLLAWERARNTPMQVRAISGVTTLPLSLLTNRDGVNALTDLAPADRIAMPALVSPQMYVLQMAAERAWGAGQHDRLKPQVVALPHPEALNAITTRSTEVTAYFSSAPFTQRALATPGVRPILSSEDVFGGKASFLAFGATRRAVEANPVLPVAVAAAMAEAAAIIRDEPERAADVYIAVEQPRGMERDAVVALVRDVGGDFGPGLAGVQAFSDFMGRIGQLRNPPASWREVADPAIHDTASS